MNRVVVTGMSGISCMGADWTTISESLRAEKNFVRVMPEWDRFAGLNTRLASPISDFSVPPEYPRKNIRSMGRVSLLATVATNAALSDAGLLDHPALSDGRTGIAYGSSAGSTKPMNAFGQMLSHGDCSGLTATSYIQMMAHTTAVNVSLFFSIRGRVHTTSSACTSGTHAIGYAYAAIKFGKQKIMVAGGAEELCPTQAAVFDILYATSQRNDRPDLTPRPFDADRDGLVIGEGAGTLILEDLEHATARGAPIYAEIVGFGTNCDAQHVTQPSADTMQRALSLALDDADIPAAEIGYVSAHGTATERGDIAESIATERVFKRPVPISSLKSYTGHTMGACGALEAWLTIEMMRNDWYAPTINLDHIDEKCADLDYIQLGRSMNTEFVMSNNFAFGGINTSLIFRRWQ